MEKSAVYMNKQNKEITELEDRSVRRNIKKINRASEALRHPKSAMYV